MRFEMQLYPYHRWPSIAEMGRVAKVAEELGFDAVLVPTHVHVPEHHARIIGNEWPDQIVVATHLATVTSRIRIHFAALVVPYLGPIQTARALASIDQLSGGRVGVTIGAGWMKEEFDALGVAFEHRGAITDEYVHVMRGLWSGQEYSYSGTWPTANGTLSTTRPPRRRPSLTRASGGGRQLRQSRF
jgi:alkanesulfonate monooxygenase SsuD/methylene tetrahydromethanopterin reductase-like flavin-dependent oxidoreductase (luciferase family)